MMLGAATSRATDITWGNTATAWATGSNWVGGVAPASSLTTDRAVFDSAITVQPNAGTRIINGLVVGPLSTNLVTITSATTAPGLTIGGGGIDMSAAAGNLTLGAATTNRFTLGATQSWNVAAGRTLRLAGGLGGISGRNLNLDGAGTVNVTSATSNFIGAINLNDGMLSMNGSNGSSTGAPLGFVSATAYKVITISNNAIFRINTTYNSNVPSSSLPGNGYVFRIADTGATFDVLSGQTFTVDDGTGVGTGTANAQLQSTGAGTGILTKTGAGTLTLSTNNSNFAVFTGDIIVNGGTLALGGAGNGFPMGSVANGTTFNSGTTFNISSAATGINHTTLEPVSLNGATFTATSGAGLTRWVAPVTLTGNATFANTSAIGYTVSNTVNLDINTLTANFATTAGHVTLEGEVSGSGGVTVNATGVGGAFVLSGANTYTGLTTANGGSLFIQGTQAGNNSYTVAAGATLSLLSGAANPLDTINVLTIGTGTGTATLGLELGANTATSDRFVTPNPATTANAIVLNIAGLNGITAGTYDLISAPSGLSTATYGLGNVAGGFTYSLSNTDSVVQLTLTNSPNASGNLYWRGGGNASWSIYNGGTTNFSTDSTGLINAGSVPGPGNTVIFSAANAPFTATTVITTTLDNAVKVNDVQFTGNPAGITAVSIAAGSALSSLEIAPSSTAAGIAVGANAGAITITAPVVLGATQTFTVDPTASLTFSGGISGIASNGLIISGTVIMTNGANFPNTYNGATTIPSGSVLQAGAATSFSPNSAVTVSGTGILRINGFNNTIGSLVGNGIVENNNTTTAATLTAGGDGSDSPFSGILQNGNSAALGFTKTGAGTLILSGPNTHTGTTTVSAGVLRIGSPTTLTATNPVTLNGTGTLDLFGNSLTVGAFTSTVAAATITNTGTGTGTDVLTLSATGANNLVLAALITDGLTRKTQIVLNNSLSNTQVTTNAANTYSGGLVLANSVNGTRLNVGTVTGTPWGTGPIIIGQTDTDRAGIFFNTANQTIANPIIFNTELGNDRFGIRSDVAGSILSGVITANVNAVFSSNNAANTPTFTLTNQITGSGGLVIDLSQTGTANTVLNVTLNNATANPNNYSGDTVVGRPAAASILAYSAILSLGAADQIPNGAGTGNVTVNNNLAGQTGSLLLNGFNETINGLSGDGIVDGSTGTPTLMLGDNNATATFSGVLQNTAGSLNLTKIGSGIQTLSGTNTFSGAVTVNAGAIEFTTSANLGDTSFSNVINLNGGTLRYAGAGAQDIGGSRVVTLGSSGGTIQSADSTGLLTISGGISPASTGNLTKTGPGTVVVSGPITLNGGLGSTFVTNGTLTGSFGSSGITNLTVAANGSMQFANNVLETLTLNTGGVLTLASGARLGFELDAPLNSDQIVIPTTAVNTGTVTFDFYNLGGLAAGSYNLLTAAGGLNAASYSLGNAPNGFNYQITATPTLVKLDVTAFDPIYWTGGALTTSWASIVTGPPTTNWSNDAAGIVDATIVPNSAKTVIFSATNAVGPTIATTLDAAFIIDSIQFTADGTPTVSAVSVDAGTGGTLSLAPVSSSGGILVTPANFTATITAPLTLTKSQTWKVVDATGSLAISGNTAFNADVNKTGDGAVTLSGINTGTGTLTLNGGILNLDSSTALGNTSLVIAAGTTINSPTTNITISTTNPQSWRGNFTFAGIGGNLTFSGGAVTLVNNVTVTTLGINTLQIVDAIGDGGSNRSLTKDGSGTLRLDGVNTYGGGTTLTAGVLGIGNVAALGTGAITFNGGGFDNLTGATATLAGNLPLVFNGSTAFTGTNSLNLGTGAVTLNTTPTITVDANTLTIGGNSPENSNGLIKSGAGTLTLSGNSEYSGSTIVNAGTLNISGSLINPLLSSIVVTGGSTLTISGTVTGSPLLTALNYGTTPGNAVVNVNGGSVTLYTTAGASVAGANTAFNLTGGLVSIRPNVTTGTQNVARGIGSYGFLNVSGGTFRDTTGVAGGSRFTVSSSGGTGAADSGVNTVTAVIYVSNTGVIDHTNGEWWLNYGMGQVTVADSGKIDHTGSNNPFAIFMDTTVEGGSYGVLNLAGANAQVLTTQPIRFGNSTTNGRGNSGFINLAAGTLSLGGGMTTSLPAAPTTPNNIYLNFAGGTLKATATMTAATPVQSNSANVNATIYGAIDNSALSGAPSFSGGLKVDTDTFNVTIGAALAGAAGVAGTNTGVTQADLTVQGGSGYIGAPAVVFSTTDVVAGGSPASGYALMNGDAVAGIVITSPGTYNAGTVPTVTLIGGGGAGAFVFSAALNTVNATDPGLTKIGTGTLILSGNNTYVGPTNITAGSLTLGAGGATGSLSPNSTLNLNANSVFTINRNNAVAQGVDFSAGDINLGAFTQAGSGTTTFITNNTYPGVTTITAGALQLSDGVTNGGTTGGVGAGTITLTAGSLIFNRTDTYPLVATNLVTGAGAVVLASTGTVATVVDGQFTTTGGLIFGSAINSNFVSTLDLTNGSSSFGLATIRTDNTTPNSIILPAGKSLTLTGMTLGVANTTANITDSNLTFTGAGDLTVNGTITLGLAAGTADNATFASFATLNLTSLGSVTTTGTALNVGASRSSAGTLLLSNTANTITATTVTVGHSQGNNGASGVVSFFTFGTGTNVLQSNTINIGFSKIGGTMNFASQAPGSPGSVIITNVAGTGGANFVIGSNNGTGTGASFTGTLDLRGHNATVTAGTITLGLGNNNNTGNTTGIIQFDTGTFTVTGATILGSKSVTNGSGTATGTINISGGAFTVDAAASTFVLSSNTAATGAARGNFNLTGGIATFNIDITKAGGTNTIGTLRLDGGTLEMTGKSIGTAAQSIVFNAQSGTLQNLGELNGGGDLAKTTTGTLNMVGPMTYTGRTLVNDGVMTFTSIGDVGAANSNLGSPTLTTSVIGLGDTSTTGTLRFLGFVNQTSDRALDLAGTTGGGTLDASGNEATITYSNTFMAATGAGNKTLTLTGSNASANTLAGIIVDNLTGTNITSVEKSGTGLWVLTSASTYSGNTTVTAGTLELSGSASHATSPVIMVGTSVGSTAVIKVTALSGGANFSTGGYTLVNNQTLAGHGTVNASGVGFSSPVGTTFSPGTSVGTLAILGNSVLAGNYTWELAVAGTGSPSPITNGGSSPVLLPNTNHDVLTISGTVDVTGLVFNISSLGLTDFDPYSYYSWTALKSTGALNGTPVLGTVTGTDFASAVALGGTFSLSTDTNNVYVNFFAAPVPESALLGLIASGAVVFFRRRLKVSHLS
ncbi:autotransporter-associated beta strand repeat-containing protein [soil metagenome]